MSNELIDNGMTVAHKRGGNPMMVKGGPSLNPNAGKRAPNTPIPNRMNAMQTRLSRFMRGKLTNEWLEKWFDKLQPREQLTFISIAAPYLFVKPQPPKDPLDQFSKLTGEQLDELYQKTMDGIKASAAL